MRRKRHSKQFAKIGKKGHGPGYSSNHSTRNRSFGGCNTCRSRHLKCDERRPSCAMCQSNGVLCGGYERNIFFGSRDPCNDGQHQFRRTLFTEKERKRMSDWLVACVLPTSALRCIAQIDDECERAPTSKAFEIRRGPFGAFGSKERITQDVQAQRILEAYADSNDGSYKLLQFEENDFFSSSLENKGPTSYAELLPEPTLSSIQETWSANPLAENTGLEHIPLPESDSYLSLAPITTSADFISQPAPVTPNQPLPLVLPLSTSATLPQDAIFLVKHYSTAILGWITPFRHTKTPWHTVFIPSCKECLAALTLEESVDHARLAVFYGVLAMSALSLAFSSTSISTTHMNTACRYRRLAHMHSEHMLVSAYDIPKVSKYKTILMALITMIQISIFLKDQNETEYYFLEAEKFIRLRGLKRQKSRKVRLLHHCYAYERIFYESTLTSKANSDRRDQVRRAIESSGLVVSGQDSLSFRLPTARNLKEAMALEKSQDEGENDLHLEMPGEFAATLYPEIFGVPEKWIVLVSLIIRLEREKDAANKSGSGSSKNVLGLGEFLSIANEIESRINQIQPTTDATEIQVPAECLDDTSLLANFRCAMASALSIYFYRHIYNVDCSLLQPKVKAVCACLLRCEASNLADCAVRFIWPAFVAGCEADDTHTQTCFLNWFQKSSRQSGLPLFSYTWNEIELNWQKRGKSSEGSVRWIDSVDEYCFLDAFAPAFESGT